MRVAVSVALVFAGLAGCAGYTSGNVGTGDSGPMAIGGGSFDAGGGDAGSDGGLPDGGGIVGCASLQMPTAGFVDSCITNPPTSGTGSVNVTPTSCSVTITTGTATGGCTGVAHGSQDAFDGGCGSFAPCSAPSLPGIITCVSGNSSCTIVVCDAGASCP